MYNKDLHRLKDHSGLYLTLHLEARRPKNVVEGLTPVRWTIQISEAQWCLIWNIYLQDKDDGELNPGVLWDAAKAVLGGGKVTARTEKRQRKLVWACFTLKQRR